MLKSSKSSEEKVYDYVVIGSGFGGSVAAHRLTQKGYSVLVLEAGKRYQAKDFAKSNWNVRKFLFLPKIGLNGIMRMDVFKGLMVLSGAGVGGGSLVYANTLIEPTKEAFRNASWPTHVGVKDWGSELKAHYAVAKRMLGVTKAPKDLPADIELRKSAESLGYGSSHHEVDVGIFFGQAEKNVPDPYFNGEGPDRSGCNFCGGCMVGCRYNAKNTLDKNYLYFAEKHGAEVRPESHVAAIHHVNEGYEVDVESPGLFGKKQKIYGKNVVVAAGVLGTMKLLLKCRDDIKTLPKLSRSLGEDIRTNSESLIGVRVKKSEVDYSRGIAIASGINPNDHTKIEAVRYPAGSDAMALMSMPLVEGHTVVRRMFEVFKHMVAHPIKFFSEYMPKNFAKETIILLVMQSVDSKMGFRWKRNWLNLFRKGLVADYPNGERPPVHIPEGNQLAENLAKNIGGSAGGSISDVLNMSVTAHVLGGCPMSTSSDTGVIDHSHQVHGYPGLYVVGGASVPANLGVNPSLTITAMAERAMEMIPAKVSKSEDELSAA